MSYLFFAWFASIAYGLVVIVGKWTSKYAIVNPWLFGFLYCLFIAIFTLFPAVGFNGTNLMPTHWLFVIIAGLFFGLGTLFFTLAVFKLDASVLSSLFNFRSVFAVFLASLILKEFLTLWQAVLIAIIFIAGLFSTIDEKMTIKSFFTFGILIGLLMTLFIALQGIYTNLALQDNSYWTVSLWMPIVSTIFLLITVPLFRKDIHTIKRKQLLAMILIAGLDALATLATNKAFATNVNIASAIISLPFAMILAICFSIFKPDLLEKHTVKVYAVRIIAAGSMIIAALRLG